MLSSDLKNFRTSTSRRLLLALQVSADSLGIRNFVGPNVSKDSLYAEMSEETFANLRDKYGIIGTEMEQLAIDALCSGFKKKSNIEVHSGLVSAVVGTVPGKSFAESEEEIKLAELAEVNIMKVAADALHGIAKRINE